MYIYIYMYVIFVVGTASEKYIYIFFNFFFSSLFFSFLFFSFHLSQKGATMNAFIIFQSVIYLWNSAHFKYVTGCVNHVIDWIKTNKRTLFERLYVFLCIYFLFSHYFIKKHQSLFEQHFSPSESPDEGLLKSKRFNVDFPSNKFTTFGLCFSILSDLFP